MNIIDRIKTKLEQLFISSETNRINVLTKRIISQMRSGRTQPHLQKELRRLIKQREERDVIPFTGEHYVGQGLQDKSFDEAVALGLNPNPDYGGSLNPNLGSSEHMKGWIERDQREVLAALRTP